MKKIKDMDDTEFAEHMIPTEGDLAMAGALVSAQSRLMPQHVADLYVACAEKGRLLQVFVALAETTARVLNVREDSDAMEALLADIYMHSLAQANIDTPPRGDNKA